MHSRGAAPLPTRSCAGATHRRPASGATSAQATLAESAASRSVYQREQIRPRLGHQMNCYIITSIVQGPEMG
jgi:hypothetical protein